MAAPKYQIEFYEEKSGDIPVLRWLKEELAPTQRRAIGYAIYEVLQHLGLAVCGTEFGKSLGQGLFEFRLRRDLGEITRHGKNAERILLRVFCHAHGDRLILLVGGYDKGADPSPKRQQAEIAIARARLNEWKRRNA